jgi:hypothetical protein
MFEGVPEFGQDPTAMRGPAPSCPSGRASTFAIRQKTAAGSRAMPASPPPSTDSSSPGDVLGVAICPAHRVIRYSRCSAVKAPTASSNGCKRVLLCLGELVLDPPARFLVSSSDESSSRSTWRLVSASRPCMLSSRPTRAWPKPDGWPFPAAGKPAWSAPFIRGPGNVMCGEMDEDASKGNANV